MIADISKYQGTVDWEKAAKELDFVILRASCGSGIDVRYLENVKACVKYGIPFGAYHYVKAGTEEEAETEAEFFAKCVQSADRVPNFYVGDIEYKTQTAETTKPVCTAFIRRLRELGLEKIGLYINSKYDWAGEAIWLADFVWIPHWGKNDGQVPSDEYKPKHPYDLWQYTSKGKLAGVSGNVDLNALGEGKPMEYFTESTEPHLTEDGLADFCLTAYERKWRYWYGTCGYPCTNALYKRKKNQYPSHYTDARESGYKADIEDGAMCADCVGLIKGYFWLDGNPDGKNVYKSNGCPDKGANGLFSLTDQRGEIATIPDIPGTLVWKSGHVGVYVGDGKTVEMKGFADDCVMREVTEGPWEQWGRLPETMVRRSEKKEPEKSWENVTTIPPMAASDTPEDGGAPTYVLVLCGERHVLKAIQKSFGGTISSVEDSAAALQEELK